MVHMIKVFSEQLLNSQRKTLSATVRFQLMVNKWIVSERFMQQVFSQKLKKEVFCKQLMKGVVSECL